MASYKNNQYIRLDIPLEEIAKIEIKTDGNNRLIEELEIKEDEPNIIIAYGKKVRYDNIYSSVRILITDFETLMGKIEEIPDFIEVVIVNNKIYYNIDIIINMDSKLQKTQIYRNLPDGYNENLEFLERRQQLYNPHPVSVINSSNEYYGIKNEITVYQAFDIVNKISLVFKLVFATL